MKVVFLGPPGAGKGTQAERFAVQHGVPHISTGEMLRGAVAAGTEVGKQAQQYMESGGLVPDDVMAGVVSERLAAEDCVPGFLLDGFPRTLAQAELLEDKGVALDHVVLFDVPAEEVARRLMGRGRADDTPETVQARIETYLRQTEPLVAHYDALGLLRTVPGVGSIDEVAARLESATRGAR